MRRGGASARSVAPGPVAPTTSPWRTSCARPTRWRASSTSSSATAGTGEARARAPSVPTGVQAYPCRVACSAYELDDESSPEEDVGGWGLRADGCRAVVARGGLAVHEEGCAFRPVPCAAALLGCGWQGGSGELAAHAAGCIFERGRGRLAELDAHAGARVPTRPANTIMYASSVLN
jgi:hypothetical protein